MLNRAPKRAHSRRFAELVQERPPTTMAARSTQPTVMPSSTTVPPCDVPTHPWVPAPRLGTNLMPPRDALTHPWVPAPRPGTSLMPSSSAPLRGAPRKDVPDQSGLGKLPPSRAAGTSSPTRRTPLPTSSTSAWTLISRFKEG